MNITRREFVGTVAAGIALSGIEAPSVVPTEAFSTGFPSIDKAIGGLHKGEIMIVMGLPGTGKTNFVHKIASQRPSVEIVHGHNGSSDKLFWLNDTPAVFYHDYFEDIDAKHLRSYLTAKKEHGFVTVLSFPLQSSLYGESSTRSKWNPKHIESTSFYYCDYLVHLMPDRTARLLGSRKHGIKPIEFKIAFNMWEGCHEVLSNSV